MYLNVSISHQANIIGSQLLLLLDQYALSIDVNITIVQDALGKALVMMLIITLQFSVLKVQQFDTVPDGYITGISVDGSTIAIPPSVIAYRMDQQDTGNVM